MKGVGETLEKSANVQTDLKATIVIKFYFAKMANFPATGIILNYSESSKHCPFTGICLKAI